MVFVVARVSRKKDAVRMNVVGTIYVVNGLILVIETGENADLVSRRAFDRCLEVMAGRRELSCWLMSSVKNAVVVL
jgi:hypothetical protein